MMSILLQVFFIPLDRLFDPLFEIILRRIAEIFADLRDVRPAVTNIALALRAIDRLQILLEQITEHRIHLVEA